MRRAITMFLAAAALLACSVLAQTKPQDVELQNAIRTATVDGDLQGAIKQFQALTTKYENDRAVVAMALVHMAEAYQKMGGTESRNLYERVLREYADQKDAVTIARAKLSSEATLAIGDRLVWNGSKVDEEGRVSPDSRLITYTDWNSGDLFVHDFAAGADRAITNAGAERRASEILSRPARSAVADQSAISKDGKEVAYEWTILDGTDRFIELRVANLVGEPSSRSIYAPADVDHLYALDWSPDGKRIAIRVEHKDHSVELVIVSVANGSFYDLKSVPWGTANVAAFSPDGKWLAYDLPHPDNRRYSDVFVLATEGSREVRAVSGPSRNEIVGWSPDGAWLLFASDRESSRDLWAIAFKDGQTDGAPRVIKTGFERSVPVGITRSGTLYYVRYGAEQQATIQTASVDLASGKLTSQPIDLPHEYGSIDANPSWSADGKELAYISRGGRLGPESIVVVIRSIDTGKVREIHPDLSYAVQLAWSPDRKSFLVGNGTDFKGRSGIFTVDAETGATSVAELAQRGVFLESPAWAPDGKHFYYARRYIVLPPGASASTFFEHDLATGERREIIHADVLHNVRLSPDGRYISTPSIDLRTNSRNILLIPVNGGEPRVLMSVATSLGADELRNAFQKGPALSIASWEPDSRSLLVIKNFRDGKTQTQIYRVPIDGGGPTSVDPSLAGILSPDGKHMAFVSVQAAPQQVSEELWALENFLPKLAAAK